MKKNYKHIIWDWNGTLFNDVDLCVDVMNGILLRNKKPGISVNHYKSIFAFPVVNYYKILGLDTSEEKFKDLSVDFIGEYESRKTECMLTENAASILDEISQSGIKQSILSAYTQNTLEELVGEMKIEHHFENIVGLDNIYAAGKNGIAKKLMNKIEEPQEEILLIGDTEHDYEIARELGVDSILAATGHQTKEKLLKLGVPVVNELAELKNYISFPR